MKILRKVLEVSLQILIGGVVVWLWASLLGYTTLVVIVVAAALVLVLGKAKEVLAEKRRCAHGVKEGKNGGCPQCITEERQQRQKEWQSKLGIDQPFASEAIALRDSELSKLRKRWLSRSELYFEMNSQDFEDAVAELFCELGYEVKQTPYSNDRGKDAIASKDGKKYLIECKRYDAMNTIGRRDLAIFVAAMKEENADGGFYINTGRFANTVPPYATQENIELFDRAAFPALVNRAYPTREDIKSAKVMCPRCGAVHILPVEDIPFRSTCDNGHEIINNITAEVIRSMSSVFKRGSLKFCDRCGSHMRLLKGKYGRFWSCTRYPDCKFTKRVRSRNFH